MCIPSRLPAQPPGAAAPALPSALSFALLLALLGAAPAGAQGSEPVAIDAQVTVNYVKPEQFSDIPYNVRDRERVIKALSEHFSQLGRQLPAGQTLRVEVLDVDLAGRMYPRRHAPDDLRVLNGGADWPHMHLRYWLEENGRLVRSGDSELSNMMYLDRLNRYPGDDPLRYEKQMMDDWFRQEFGVRRAG